VKVLQIPFHYYPEAVGGTEVYVSSLAKWLQIQGTEVEIAAPADERGEYVHDGIPVHRFGITKTPSDVAMLYGKGDPEATRQFAAILDRTLPDVVHLHAMSPAVSLHVVHEIRKRGIPAVFTCHIPGITCPRGTLLRYGAQVCDGVWDLRQCTRCTLQARGLPLPVASLVAAAPAFAGKQFAARGFRGSAVTALRMRALQAGRQRTLIQFFRNVDRIVAVSGWLRDLLIANGLPADKVMLCRHGASQSVPMEPAASRTPGEGGFRIAFLGRLNPAKGAHVLVEAIRRRPRISVMLDIFAIVQNDIAYVENLRKRIGSDPRIRILGPLPNQSVVERLRDYDALAVPSQWMETGPLVVYDAFLAGIPVIGSRRGGIAELVTHERDGLLVEPADPEAWANTLERLSADERLQQQLRSGVRTPRSMSAVAAEMSGLYAEVASSLKPVHHA
jgi:glycosyltransferase involved in cell wall biosynthesis